MIISPPKIRIFPCFKTVISIDIDKPVNRSKHAYAVTQLNFFAFRGFFFHNILKKQGRGLTKSGYKIQKINGGKMYSRTLTIGAKLHKSNIGDDSTTSIKY